MKPEHLIVAAAVSCYLVGYVDGLTRHCQNFLGYIAGPVISSLIVWGLLKYGLGS